LTFQSGNGDTSLIFSRSAASRNRTIPVNLSQAILSSLIQPMLHIAKSCPRNLLLSLQILLHTCGRRIPATLRNGAATGRSVWYFM